MGIRYGGRKKGTPNKATAEVKALAMQYTPDAIKGLVKLAKTAKSEQARVAAWREILDRACGRPAQAVEVTNPDGSMALAWKAAIRAADSLLEPEPETHVEH